MGEFKTTPALSTTAGSTTPTLLKNLHAATAEAAGIPLDTPFTGKQLIKVAEVSATPGASKIVQADATGKLAAGWFQDVRCKATVGFTTGAQALAAGAGLTAIQFDAEEYDTDSLHSLAVNRNRFTAPVDGMYMVSLTGNVSTGGSIPSVAFLIQHFSPPGGAEAIMFLDGSNVYPGGGWPMVPLLSSLLVRLLAGEYVSCSVWYTGSTSGTLTAQCTIARVG